MEKQYRLFDIIKKAWKITGQTIKGKSLASKE